MDIVLMFQTYRPWNTTTNEKIRCETEAYRNFGKQFHSSLAIKRHIVMAAPIVETISLVNGF